MNCVITMAGRGSRFRDRGFERPKYEIRARQHTLFEWSLISLKALIENGSHFVFVCLKENNSAPFLKQKCQELGITAWDLAELPEVTDGQATSVLHARDHLSQGDPLTIYNIDTHIQPFALADILKSGGPVIPCFKAAGDHWSFVQTDAQGVALRTAEKVRISDRASLGLYTFTSFTQFHEAYTCTYEAGAKIYKEKYIAPMYNVLLERGVHVTAPLVDSKCIAPLGTPDEVESFQTSNLSWPGLPSKKGNQP